MDTSTPEKASGQRIAVSGERLTPATLLPLLQQLPSAGRWWVGLSGGVDSTVLLHLLSRLRQQQSAQLSALHVDHGIHPQSAAWAEWCQRYCQSLQIPFEVQRIKLTDPPDGGVEAALRRLRYQHFTAALKEGDLLFLGHHQDDQAETMLLQLLRGCGVRGAAAMPPLRRLGAGWLLRPLLGVSRQAIEGYARHHQLSWIEDPSNQSRHHDRNYLRHQLLPALQQRRQGVVAALARSSDHFREAEQLLEEVAEEDLQRWQRGADAALELAAFETLSPGRSRNLLRHWIVSRGFSLPSTARLEQILTTVVTAAVDRRPTIRWQGTVLSRYRGRLYLYRPLPPPQKGGEHYALATTAPTQLSPSTLGRIEPTRIAGGGIALRWLEEEARVELRWRQGGERISPQGRSGHHTLKNIFQEAGIPPWLRPHWPLIYLNGELAQLPGICTATDFAPPATGTGLLFQWRRDFIE
ncbi:MAG: tRNA lysidine(34) synthetase TilS [Gammaproteobacteria bacterium]|nr:tRNA lysidine(34) synthetase TilS [Gammaproteobacteria bacterium]